MENEIEAALKKRDAEWREAIAPGNADTTLGEMLDTPQNARLYIEAREWCHRETLEYFSKRAAKVRDKFKRVRDAIVWASGVRGDFHGRQDGDGQYYWRKELIERAGMREIVDRAAQEIAEDLAAPAAESEE